MSSQSLAADPIQREPVAENESTLTRWAERGLIPDGLLRFGIRRQCALRLSQENALGVEATAVRLTAAEQLLEGQPAQAAQFEQAGKAGAAELDDPMSCIHASSAYRRHLVGVLTTRALGEAAARTH